MKKGMIGLIVLILVLALAGTYFFFFGNLRPQNAGLLIETNPSAIVFIDNQQVGRTPYEATLKPGEIAIKLVPETLNIPLAPYETKVGLTSGIKTVIRRDFAETEETSSGEVISFEKTGGNEASLSVVSIPDSSQVSLDGQAKGFTPLKISRVAPGEHQLAILAKGYFGKTLSVKVIEGYRLTAIIKLAFNPEAEMEEQEETEEEILQEVEILNTPTGFLRVREEPTINSSEIGQVNPGDKYQLLEQDPETGWYKIIFSDQEQGWISDEYATLSGEVEE